MCSREKRGDSLAKSARYNEHLFIITFLAMIQTAKRWINLGIYTLLSFCIIGTCFFFLFTTIYGGEVLLISTGKNNHLTPNVINLQTEIVVGPETC